MSLSLLYRAALHHQDLSLVAAIAFRACSLRALIRDRIVRDHISRIRHVAFHYVAHKVAIVNLVIPHECLQYTWVILCGVVRDPIPRADLFISQGEVTRLRLVCISFIVFLLTCCQLQQILLLLIPSLMNDRGPLGLPFPERDTSI